MQGVFQFESGSRKERVALRYCDAIMRNPTLANDAMWQELHAEFTEPQLVELGHYVGFMSGGQRWLLTLHTQHGELAAEIAQREAAAEEKQLSPAAR